MFGILNLNKPKFKTSRDAVSQVQRLIRSSLGCKPKIGHAGTLDPLATGVLLIGIGPATRLIKFLQQAPKRYVAEFVLGKSSNTEDIFGEITELNADPVLESQISDALPNFTGVIEQVPPAFSAIKIEGKRAYQLARKGKTVELTPRKVTVHSIRVNRFDYPELELEICCGSGTYVRSLGRDIAVSLGSGALMKGLVRTAIGQFAIEQAVGPEDLDSSRLESYLAPPLLAVSDLHRFELTHDQIRHLSVGGFLDRESMKEVSPAANAADYEAAAVDDHGNLVAVMAKHQGTQFRPNLNFAHYWLSKRGEAS